VPYRLNVVAKPADEGVVAGKAHQVIGPGRSGDRVTAPQNKAYEVEKLSAVENLPAVGIHDIIDACNGHIGEAAGIAAVILQLADGANRRAICLCVCERAQDLQRRRAVDVVDFLRPNAVDVEPRQGVLKILFVVQPDHSIAEAVNRASTVAWVSNR
jgi:hypothetical protein